ncbi:MAG: hypothetical protein ACON4T_09085 [Synechococcus sp.]
MRRLEQVTALVVAAGLAIVSYWLFFSWAGGGGYSREKQRSQLGCTQSQVIHRRCRPLGGGQRQLG